MQRICPRCRFALASDGLIADGVVKVAKLLQLAGLASSAGEANRKIAENAVSINGAKFSGIVCAKEQLGERPALRLGKRAVQVEWVS